MESVGVNGATPQRMRMLAHMAVHGGGSCLAGNGNCRHDAHVIHASMSEAPAGPGSLVVKETTSQQRHSLHGTKEAVQDNGAVSAQK
jgi:hypothetical protein